MPTSLEIAYVCMERQIMHEMYGAAVFEQYNL